MTGAAKPTPARFPEGVSTDAAFQPLAMFGLPNPFSYNVVADDFDFFGSSQVGWTVTATTNGTIATTDADGGVILLTTNSSTPVSTDLCSIQAPAKLFTLPAAPLRFFFLTRIQVSDVTNVGIIAGLIQTTTTPFTVVDGLYFYKASGSATNLVLRSTVGSANVDLTIPTASYTLANNTYIDLGFEITRTGDVVAFVDSKLVGFIPQSGTGLSTPNRGAVGRMTAPTLTTAAINPTIAIKSGTTASKTAKADFILAAKER